MLLIALLITTPAVLALQYEECYSVLNGDCSELTFKFIVDMYDDDCIVTDKCLQRLDTNTAVGPCTFYVYVSCSALPTLPPATKEPTRPSPANTKSEQPIEWKDILLYIFSALASIGILWAAKTYGLVLIKRFICESCCCSPDIGVRLDSRRLESVSRDATAETYV